MIPEKFKYLVFGRRLDGVEYVTLSESPVGLWTDERYRKIFPKFFDAEGFIINSPDIGDALTKEAVAFVKVNQEYRDYIINFVIKNRL